jgi:hypothetical protein|tara:strand:- start:151 stop:252 length:102 start_codon:yes stop_codon:yes gene_type:complete
LLLAWLKYMPISREVDSGGRRVENKRLQAETKV